jgi:hypothetical protein
MRDLGIKQKTPGDAGALNFIRSRSDQYFAQFKRSYVLVFFQKLPQCLVGIVACGFIAPLAARTQGTWPMASNMSRSGVIAGFAIEPVASV